MKKLGQDAGALRMVVQARLDALARIVAVRMSSDARVREVIRRVESNPATGLIELAHAVELSTWHLDHLFHFQTGQSVFRLVLAHRLIRAAHFLLVTENPIKEISDSLGYHHPQNFARSFSLHLGISPGEYRELSRLQPSSSLVV